MAISGSFCPAAALPRPGGPGGSPGSAGGERSFSGSARSCGNGAGPPPVPAEPNTARFAGVPGTRIRVPSSDPAFSGLRDLAEHGRVARTDPWSRAVELGDGWAPFAVSPTEVREWLGLAAKTDALQRREAPPEGTLGTAPPAHPPGAPHATRVRVLGRPDADTTARR